ncbi:MULTISPECIES: DUF6884 domain-containing protein [Streptomyces]|uniref:DUF6884 domain-containing protein n=1 Tax=Streptomyces TaxID=1883 RepID=UPI002E1663F6|nr:DUF6884 domain-containing protein [Streptomyces subrutilus]WSJ29028.1 hypothetical protein OG479_06720 [Streptomyces subrutilus]
MSAPGPMPGTLVIAGCSRRKTAAATPVPALDLYQGGIVPQLRGRLAGHPQVLERVWFLSAEHGLLGARTRVMPYERALTEARARLLRPAVCAAVRERLDALGHLPAQILLVAEPAYLSLLADVLGDEGRPLIRWITEPRGWDDAAAVLDDWNWP